MHVLQLVTNDDAPFFRQQIESLESLGITSDVRSPSGERSASSPRSPTAYARLGLETLRESPQQYDLVHANYGLMAPPALLGHRLPTVVSFWGSDLLGQLGGLCRLCARRADESVVMSPAMADALDEPCHIIPHGIDMGRFRPIPTETAREEIGWSDTGKHVLFPYSPDRPVKNFPVAAGVVAETRHRIDGPISLHPLSGVDHHRMPYYYNAADAVLLTSKHEGSPNAVREALACNTPVVATDVGDIEMWLSGLSPSAVCQSNEQLADALALVLRSDQQIQGRERAHETSAEEMGRQLAEVYERAVAKEPDTAELISPAITS